jgi:CBS-domain-containing membrane protein
MTLPVHRTATDPLTVADAMEPCEYQIADDSPVDRADDILRSAHVGYLVVRGHDGRCAGLVTSLGLRERPGRSRAVERTTVRDVISQRGPFAWPSMALRMAAFTMRIKCLSVWPVIDDDGYVLGIVTAERVDGLLALAPE